MLEYKMKKVRGRGHKNYPLSLLSIQQAIMIPNNIFWMLEVIIQRN